MDLALSEEQEMLKAAVRRFVDTEYPKETLLELSATGQSAPSEPWQKLAGTGWLGIVIPTEYGGEGGSFTDAGVFFEELGRGPVPGPHLSTAALGALTILEAGTDEQKRSLLPDIAAGRRTVALAITEADYQWDESDVQTLATADGDGYRIAGTKVYVSDATAATDLICAVRTENRQHVGLVIVPADAPGVSIRRLEGFAWNLAEVRLDGVQVARSAVLGGSFAGGWEALERAVAASIPLLCAFQVGGSQQVYEMSVDYSRTRIQFGTPIGRFQRVQDHIINLVNELDAARWTTYEALWKLDSERNAADSIHLAKAVSSAAYYNACNHAHEVHAGVGSTTEYGLTLHTTASRTLYQFLGDPKFHRRRLADALGL
jgi:alkylation response protein AidB-like acyl-CoA dehydrogenase